MHLFGRMSAAFSPLFFSFNCAAETCEMKYTWSVITVKPVQKEIASYLGVNRQQNMHYAERLPWNDCCHPFVGACKSQRKSRLSQDIKRQRETWFLHCCRHYPGTTSFPVFIFLSSHSHFIFVFKKLSRTVLVSRMFFSSFCMHQCGLSPNHSWKWKMRSAEPSVLCAVHSRRHFVHCKIYILCIVLVYPCRSLFMSDVWEPYTSGHEVCVIIWKSKHFLGTCWRHGTEPLWHEPINIWDIFIPFAYFHSFHHSRGNGKGPSEQPVLATAIVPKVANVDMFFFCHWKQTAFHPFDILLQHHKTILPIFFYFLVFTGR